MCTHVILLPSHIISLQDSLCAAEFLIFIAVKTVYYVNTLQLIYPFYIWCTFVIFQFEVLVNKAAKTILVLHTPWEDA